MEFGSPKPLSSNFKVLVEKQHYVGRYGSIFSRILALAMPAFLIKNSPSTQLHTTKTTQDALDLRAYTLPSVGFAALTAARLRLGPKRNHVRRLRH